MSLFCCNEYVRGHNGRAVVVACCIQNVCREGRYECCSDAAF